MWEQEAAGEQRGSSALILPNAEEDMPRLTVIDPQTSMNHDTDSNNQHVELFKEMQDLYRSNQNLTSLVTSLCKSQVDWLKEHRTRLREP